VRSILGIAVLVAMAVILPSCNDIINYPAPTIVGLVPPSVNAGTQQFTLTVTGFKFTPASQIEWNGQVRFLTYFQTINTLTAQVPASLVVNAGNALVTVFTPQPGGGVTQSLTFAIDPVQTPTPVISSIQPASVLAGSSAFTLYVTGSNFVAQSTVTVNGTNRAATIVNSSQLQIGMTASDVATAGQIQIEVINPTPGGGSSTPANLTVTNPVPILASLSPVSFAAGTTTSSTLAITGSSFVPNSVVDIDGSPRVTTFTGSTQLSVQLLQGDFVAAGNRQVQIINPSPGGGISNIVAFSVNPTLTAGLPVLVDTGVNGAEANQGVCGQSCSTGPLTLTTAGPSISSNGSTVVFASTSTNFFMNQANTGSDIYAHTTCLTSSSCTPTTTDVSVGPNKTTSNGSSSEPSISSGGGQAAFTSTATNLVNGVPFTQSMRQVYWMPVCAATATSCAGGELVSLSADGLNPGNGESYNPSISPDGRYVAFVSLATNLVTGLTTLDGVTPQVFVHDTCNGVSSTTCTPTTLLVSTPDGSTPANGPSSDPSAANEGAYVSFTSTASNLGATAPNPAGAQEIFVRTTCFVTTTCTGVTTLVSTPDGVTPANNSSSESNIVSGGRFVVFASTATNLVAGSGPTQQIYMFDTCLNVTTTPVCNPSATLISTPDGTTPGNAISEHPQITEGNVSTTTSTTNGELIAFASRASNLNPNSGNFENIFVRKSCVGFLSTTVTCTPVTVLASQPIGTSPAQGNGDSIMPVISGDNHSVAFISSANNLVPNDTNGFANVFLALTSF
jgi:WD40-like Beta Propeller Repeat